MLSEALFFISFLMILPMVFMSPFAGALAYEWLQYMPPYAIYNVYAIGNLSLIMGGLALILWVIKDKKEKPAAIGLLFTFAVYIIWVNITQVTSIVGPGGDVLWDRAYKVLLFTFALSFMVQTRVRIEAFIWIVCLSIGNFVISGAIKTILSGGGGFAVVGGGANILGERVSFAIAVATIIPLVRFLRDHMTLIQQTRRMRLLFDGFTIACVFAVIGTQARTGLVALLVLGVFYFLKSSRKMTYLLALPVVAGLGVMVAPAEWFDRMKTITSANQDASFMGRVDSWIWGWNFALEHPLVGGGFHSYLMHYIPTWPGFLEAHNIFFETLADHGFPGLFLFMLLMALTYTNCNAIRRRTKGVEGLEWARDLATMLQLSLVTFLAGSQLLSDATQSMPYEIVALSIGLRGVAERKLAQDSHPVILRDAAAPAPPRPQPQLGTKSPVPAMAYANRQ